MRNPKALTEQSCQMHRRARGAYKREGQSGCSLKPTVSKVSKIDMSLPQCNNAFQWQELSHCVGVFMEGPEESRRVV